MAKKRGGLAGLYDRNKGVIKTVAPIAAGFIPGIGPAIGAGIGAAIGGLDREGKSGIGLDVMGAAKGGLSGYGGAKLGQATRGGIGKLFTGGMSPVDKLTGAPEMGVMTQTTSGAAPVMPGAGAARAASAPSASMYGNIPAPKMAIQPKIATQMADPIRNPVARAAGSVAKKAGSSLGTKEGLAFAGNALQTGANIMGSQAQAAQQERDYEEQQRQLQARAEIMALFAPQMAGNLGMSGFGGAGAPITSFQQYANDAAALATDDPRVNQAMRLNDPENDPYNFLGRSPIYGNPRRNYTTGPNRRTFMNNPER
jgi:hypothetical protein